MKDLSRRQAIRLGAWGTLGVAIGGVGLSQTGLPWRETTTAGAELAHPAVLRSSGGRLEVDLVAGRHRTTIAGRDARVLGYGGTLPGRTWRVKPGDRIDVRLRNELDAPTNLHTHGLAVSPRGNGDNPFLSIDPGESFDYTFQLPDDHPTGVAWYHPHRHGTVADQLFGGLYGALIVEGDDVPASRERVLIISDISLTASGDVAPASQRDVMMGREGELLLVNGQHQPEISARAGDSERWRVINACTSRYIKFAVPGQDVQLLGIDMGRESTPRGVSDVLLPPGGRADLLVALSSGTSDVQTLGHSRGGMGMMGGGLSGPATLATLRVTGDGAAESIRLAGAQDTHDLRGRPIARARDISFTMTMGMRGGRMMDMGFDGRAFDIDRIDQGVDAGIVEDWTISNPTPMDHPFHLHVWPMQVIEANGQPVGEPDWRDVVNVPAQGRVRVLVDFSRNPGRSVYHCHILDHEDAGMMAIVEVQ